MANIAFKKGLLANLPSTYAEGTLYVTTDERGMYLDISDSARIRIGDFQEFANLEALQANTNPSTTALYYITDLNVLAKWNGTSYVQINLDTGATFVEVVGDGNAVTAASYDAASRKLTLTMGTTFATPADVDGKITALDLANTYEQKGAAAAAKSEVIGTDADPAASDTIKGAKKYADQKVASVQAGDASMTVGGTASNPTVAVKVSEDAGNALTLAEDGLKVSVPAATDYSVTVTESSENPDYAKVYTIAQTATGLNATINIPKDMMVESGTVEVYDDAGDWGEAGTYLHLVLANTAEDDIYINVSDLIEYVTSGSSDGDQIMISVSADHKVTATLSDGSVSKAQLDAGVQASLDKADSAEQNAKNYTDTALTWGTF